MQKLTREIIKNICIIISMIIALVIFAPFLCVIIGKTEPATDLIAAIVAVLIGIISISFPIMIGNTAQRLSRYNNKYIATIFKEEPTYKQMLCIIYILIGVIIAFLFFSYSSEIRDRVQIISQVIAIFSVILCVYALLVFRKFWEIFSDYNVNTDEKVLEKIDGKVQSLLQQQRPSFEYLDYMDMYYQILYTKLKVESYVDISNIHKKQSELVWEVFRNYQLSNVPNPELQENLKLLFHKYYLSAYLCWSKSFRENADAAFSTLYEYYRLLNDLLPEVIHNKLETYQPLFFLYQRIAGDLTVHDTLSIPNCRTAPWDWYMNILSSETIPTESLFVIDQQLLAVMRIVIQNGNHPVFNSFISNTIDGIWFIKTNAPNISNDKYIDLEINIEPKLSRIFFELDLNNIKKTIDERINDDDSLKNELYKYCNNYYKYNHIRLVTIILGAYCLFKKRYDYIEYLLNYNQPQKGNTQFLNPDIIPNDINILLQLYAESHMFHSMYHFVWEDHNDGQYWFKQFLSLLICTLKNKKRSILQYDNAFQDNKQRLEYYISCIEEMQKYLNDFITNEEDVGKVFKNNNIEAAIDVLNGFQDDIQGQIKEIVVRQPLSKDKIEKFKSNIRLVISKNTIWANILTGTLDGNEILEYTNPVGYKTLIEKSFLAEDDTGIYIGFEHSIATIIVRQIDFFIESRLRVLYKLLPTKREITKSNFKDKVFELDNSWNVVFINYPHIMEWLWNKPDFQWGKDINYLVGTTDHGTLIYSTIDSTDRNARVIIFKRDCISKITGIEDIDIKVDNTSDDKELVETLLNENPDWLEPYNTEEEKRNAILRNVYIQISKKISFSHTKEPDIYIFDNI